MCPSFMWAKLECRCYRSVCTYKFVWVVEERTSWLGWLPGRWVWARWSPETAQTARHKHNSGIITGSIFTLIITGISIKLTTSKSKLNKHIKYICMKIINHYADRFWNGNFKELPLDQSQLYLIYCYMFFECLWVIQTKNTALIILLHILFYILSMYMYIYKSVCDILVVSCAGWWPSRA